MDPGDELTHVLAGGWPEPGPKGGDTFLALAPAGPEHLGERCREVLEVVLRHSLDGWPELEEWRRLLPGWFVDACLDDSQVDNCVLDQWSLRGWLHWLRPENRRWFWWSAEPAGAQSLRVTVAVPQRPYLSGALEWLLKTGGATSVERRSLEG